MTDLDEQIRRAVEPLPGIDVLVLFGSRAAGRPRADSDLDVAVLPATDDPRGRRRVLGEVAVALAELAPLGRVDVVLLDEAPALLRQRIMEGGRLLLCRAPGRWRAWRLRTMREYGDMEPARRLFREALHRRLAG
jgi:predicted nucleotidyltransferase